MSRKQRGTQEYNREKSKAAEELDEIDRKTGLSKVHGWEPLNKAPDTSARW